MQKRLFLKILAGFLAFTGLGLLVFVTWPIIAYELTSLGETQLISPVPDLTRASNWFPGGAGAGDFTASGVAYYTLAIPKLRIEGATVAIGGEDLSKSLVQYPGTALPGKRGNAVIFGHSILPQFFNPKDYISIFSTLPTLKVGDEVLVKYDGISYRYRVENMFEVLPTDIQVLEQDTSDSFLTLVTCVPPGHPLKPRRLIVRARLIG